MKRKYFVLGLLAVAGVAIACAILPSIQTPAIDVSASDTSAETWREVAEELGDIYQNTYKGQEILVVREHHHAFIADGIGARPTKAAIC